MIIDSHCHAWERWPYEAGVPAERGSIEALLASLDENGVDRALVVAANIGAGDPETDNAGNNDYVARAVLDNPERLDWVADIDSHWSTSHHQPGAAERLEAQSSGAVGFTHYVTGEDDGWFSSADGREFFDRAEQMGLLASIHARPPWFRAVARMIEAHPELPVLLHHQGHAASEEEVDALSRLASLPSVHVKVSGFYYVSDEGYPYRAAMTRLERIVKAFGAERLMWGSDFPVSRSQLTYRETLDIVRTEATFLDDSERDAILGGTMNRLLARSTTA